MGLEGVSLLLHDDPMLFADIVETITVCIIGVHERTLSRGGTYDAAFIWEDMVSLSLEGTLAWNDICRLNPPAGFWLKQEDHRPFPRHVAQLITVRKLLNVAEDKPLAVAGGWLSGPTPRARWPNASVPDACVVRVGAVTRSELPDLSHSSSHRNP